ncbi:MAG: hypothetical protein FWC00_01345 [Firmicutes bacterium]|nr:hypothetical protein [Bacillota bacterium]
MTNKNVNKDIADALDAFLTLGQNPVDEKAKAKLKEICERNKITLEQLSQSVMNAVKETK